jgi:hypothetical protein
VAAAEEGGLDGRVWDAVPSWSAARALLGGRQPGAGVPGGAAGSVVAGSVVACKTLVLVVRGSAAVACVLGLERRLQLSRCSAALGRAAILRCHVLSL